MTSQKTCQYTSVKVPKKLAELVMNDPKVIALGYRSFSEFALEASRLRVEYLENKYANN